MVFPLPVGATAMKSTPFCEVYIINITDSRQRRRWLQEQGQASHLNLGWGREKPWAGNVVGEPRGNIVRELEVSENELSGWGNSCFIASFDAVSAEPFFSPFSAFPPLLGLFLLALALVSPG